MSKIDDGGPAFAPYGAPHPTDPNKVYHGMSLRDHFAGQAMTGIANQLSKMIAVKDVSREEILEAYVAASHLAYGLADGMLSVRQPPTTDKEKD